MKTKSVFYKSLVLLIALFATVQTAIAQIPCGPTPNPSPTLAVNWPQWQYDAAHSGCNPYEHILNRDNVTGLKPTWRYGGHPYDGNYSVPVVADGVLFVSWTEWDTDNLKVLALNARTGTEIWSYQEPLVEFASPVVANGMVYVSGHDWPNDLYYLYALNARTGTLIWKYAVEGGPVVASGVVYVTSDDGNVYALNAKTGALLWRYATGGQPYYPAVANGMVYVGSADHKVYTLDATTGTLVWSYASGNHLSPSPSVVAGIAYFAADEIYALNATTGALIWEYPIASRWPAVANGVVYISSGTNVYALNAATGALVWKSDDFCGGFGCTEQDGPGSPVVANGVVYVTSDYAAVTTLDAKTGAFLLHRTYDRESFHTSPMVANGMVYFGVENFYPLSNSLQAYSISGH